MPLKVQSTVIMDSEDGKECLIMRTSHESTHRLLKIIPSLAYMNKYGFNNIFFNHPNQLILLKGWMVHVYTKVL